MVDFSFQSFKVKVEVLGPRLVPDPGAWRDGIPLPRPSSTPRPAPRLPLFLSLWLLVSDYDYIYLRSTRRWSRSDAGGAFQFRGKNGLSHDHSAREVDRTAREPIIVRSKNQEDNIAGRGDKHQNKSYQ